MEWEIQDYAAVYGAALATALAIIQAVAWWHRRRPRVDSTYNLLGHPDMIDSITIANLRPTPLQIKYWTLAWEPTFFRFWLGRKDQTPERDPDDDSVLTIEGHATEKLAFGGDNKINWNYKTAAGRKLVLTLHPFGRRRPLRVRVK